MRLACLIFALFASSAWGEDHVRITMTDGRVLAGSYDAVNHELTIGVATLHLDPSKIAKIETGIEDASERQPELKTVDINQPVDVYYMSRWPIGDGLPLAVQPMPGTKDGDRWTIFGGAESMAYVGDFRASGTLPYWIARPISLKLQANLTPAQRTWKQKWLKASAKIDDLLRTLRRAESARNSASGILDDARDRAAKPLPRVQADKVVTAIGATSAGKTSRSADDDSRSPVTSTQVPRSAVEHDTSSGGGTTPPQPGVRFVQPGNKAQVVAEATDRRQNLADANHSYAVAVANYAETLADVGRQISAVVNGELAPLQAQLSDGSLGIAAPVASPMATALPPAAASANPSTDSKERVASTAVAPPIEPVLTEFTVEALIDGGTELHIDPRQGIYWKQIGPEAKPGHVGGRNQPTYINAATWMPSWSHTDLDQGPDISAVAPLRLALGDYDVVVSSNSMQRGGVAADEREAIYVVHAIDETVVEIKDPKAGARWYTLRATHIATPDATGPAPTVVAVTQPTDEAIAAPTIGRRFLSLSDFIPDVGAQVTEQNGIITLTSMREHAIQTRANHAVPFAVSMDVLIRKDNLRVAYGRGGSLIFNWELNQNDLRVQRWGDGSFTHLDLKGNIPSGTWHHLDIEIRSLDTRISVDHVERCNIDGKNVGLDGPFRIFSAFGGTISLKGITISNATPHVDGPIVGVAGIHVVTDQELREIVQGRARHQDELFNRLVLAYFDQLDSTADANQAVGIIEQLMRLGASINDYKIDRWVSVSPPSIQPIALSNRWIGSVKTLAAFASRWQAMQRVKPTWPLRQGAVEIYTRSAAQPPWSPMVAQQMADLTGDREFRTVKLPKP